MTSVRTRRHAYARSERGFTLLEVIVAFALLAGALMLLLGAISGGARQVRESEQASRASLYAQSLLANAGVDAPLEPGQREGAFEDGRYRWVLRVQDYVDPAVAPVASVPRGSPRLRELILDVHWGSDVGQGLQWRTLRLVADGNHG